MSSVELLSAGWLAEQMMRIVSGNSSEHSAISSGIDKEANLSYVKEVRNHLQGGGDGCARNESLYHEVRESA
jgi:hypothetical protein